jgi:hypothetical protein
VREKRLREKRLREKRLREKRLREKRLREKRRRNACICGAGAYVATGITSTAVVSRC